MSAMRTRGKAAHEPLAQLLERVATQLPPSVLIIVLRPLPTIELARLACVHKAFWLTLASLRQQHPCYSPPTAKVLKAARRSSRLLRAAIFGDVAVIAFMAAAGVDEHGTPLVHAREAGSKSFDEGGSTLDEAYSCALELEHFHAAKLLLSAGVDVNENEGWALRMASAHGYTNQMAFLLLNGASVDACEGQPLKMACSNGHAAAASLLIAHGADVVSNGYSLVYAEEGHADVVALLLQHNADVHYDDDFAVRVASDNGHEAVVRLLIQHGADAAAAAE
jgi:ankyrin repeat protein